MKKILKWTGAVVGSLAIIALIFYAIVYFNIEHHITKTYTPGGSCTQQLFTTILCTDKTSAGRQIDNENMPWKMTAQYTHDEIKHYTLTSIK